MAYRKPYYRKDGTYVSGSNDNRSYRNNNQKPSNESVIIVAIILIFLFLIVKCS